MRTSGTEAKEALAKHPELGTNLWYPIRIKLLQRYERVGSEREGNLLVAYERGEVIRVTAAEAALLIEADQAVLAEPTEEG
jgi:hypothetical protein